VRIAFVGTELCSITSPTGALEKLVQGWALEIARRDEVFLFDLHPEGPDVREFHGIPVISVLTPGDLAARLRAINADVVQTNNRPLWETGDALRVNTFHNFPNAWTAQGEPRESELILALKRGRSTAVSAALARHVEQRYQIGADRVAISYPFVDQEYFDATHSGGGGILFPNRLIRKKGPEVVLKALAILGESRRATFCDYVTPFLRDSREYREIREKVRSSHVALIPHIESRREMAELYASSDVVVTVATEPEGMGLIPLEAQAVGAPVVTAGPGGLSEATFSPNVHLPEISAERLAAAIDAAAHRSSSSEASEIVRSTFTVTSSTEMLERSWSHN
jgi:glycosyltransferase involved in cell wall biosynthesis